MSTIKTGWLLNKSGEKFAPKTLLSQVSTDDGVLLEQKLEDDFNEIRTYINEKHVDPLAGKKILCLGDSLMAGDGWTGGFANCIQENHPDAIITNLAASGYTLIQNDTDKYIYKQFQSYYKPDDEVHGEEPDLIIFTGGGNDCIYRATIGTGKLDSCYVNGNMATMCDALEYLIYAIGTVYPNTKILYITTPMVMQSTDTTAIPSIPTPDVQLEYLVAREKVLEKWGIPKADIRREGNLTGCMSNKTPLYFSDSLHLNEAGYRYVSPIIEAALKKIF